VQLVQNRGRDQGQGQGRGRANLHFLCYYGRPAIHNKDAATIMKGENWKQQTTNS